MLAFSLSGALDAGSLSTADVTDAMIDKVLDDSYGSEEEHHFEQITLGVGGILPLASGAAGDRPALPDVDAVELSASMDPGVLDELRAFNEENGEDTAAADDAAAAAAEAEDDEGGGRGKRKRTSRFVEVDGFMVLKLNDYALEDGEPSVFGSELKAPAPKAAKRF